MNRACTRSRLRNPSGFTPGSLFSAGEKGAWYDPSDLSTLFQDNLGTVPVTAAGQIVGMMRDKSGNGNHAVQATGAAKPILRNTGLLWWVEFDGIDDFLVTSTMDFSTLNKLSLFAGARKLSDTATQMLAEFSPVITNPGTFYLRAATSGAFDTVSTTDGIAFASDVGPAVAAPNTTVLTSIFDNAAAAGSQILYRVDAVSQAPNTGSTPAGNFGNFPLYIGRRGGLSLPFSGNLYGLIIRGASTTAADIVATEKYIGTKSGLAL